jgi:NTE family protein
VSSAPTPAERGAAKLEAKPPAEGGAAHAATSPALAHPWRVFAVASLATFVAYLDATIVNVAFPDIRSDFHSTGLGVLSWVINGYALLFAALLVIFGRVADRVGRRRVFLAGVALFGVASAVCGAAPSPETLIAARVVQGAGAAAMVPAALAVLLPAFPPAKRATVVGLWGAVASVASALGPPLGGALTDAFGWRAVFLVNVPIAAAAVAAGIKALPESRAEHETEPPDYAGAALLAGATAALALGLLQGNDWGWRDARVIAAFAAAIALAGALAYRSKRHPAPILEAALWRVRSFGVANTASFFFGGTFFAMALCGVLFLTGVWHYSMLDAGLAIMPGPLASAVSATLGGRVADRRGQRPVIVAGALVYAAGLGYLILALDGHRHFLTDWLPGQTPVGLGVGLALPAMASAAARSLPAARFATGMAMNLTARQLGAVVGIALLIVIVGTPSPAHAVAAYQAGFAFCAIAGLLSGIVALALKPARPHLVALPAEARA